MSEQRWENLYLNFGSLWQGAPCAHHSLSPPSPSPPSSEGSVTLNASRMAAAMAALSLPFIFRCLIKRNEPESEKDDTGEIKM